MNHPMVRVIVSRIAHSRVRVGHLRKCGFPLVALGLALNLWATPAASQTIVQVSIPEHSQDSMCRPRDEGVWSVSTTPPTPLNVNSGIGYILNPVPPITSGFHFALHDHQYVGAHVPDPGRAVVTYRFDTPAIVRKLDIRQHANGISRVEGQVSNDGTNWTSIGSVFGPAGDVTGYAAFTEHDIHSFDFGNTSQSGTYFRFIARKTNEAGGYAIYRAFPQFTSASDAPAVPEPSALALFLPSFVLGCVLLRSRGRCRNA